MPETTYESAVAHFTRSKQAVQELQRWRALPGKGPVMGFAEQLVARRLYDISPGQVEEACSQTRHALTWPDGRRLRRSVGQAVTKVADWYPEFPLVHTLYYAVEVFGRPPLWDEFVGFWRDDPQAKIMLGTPAGRQVRLAIANGENKADAEEAMWWRLGNAYYSLLRELYVLSSLRRLGLDVQYHVIADALFRADFWIGDSVISLYVANDRYRGARGGRKRHPREILGDCPSFTFADMPRLTRHEYGTVHLPSRSEIERFAELRLAPAT